MAYRTIEELRKMFPGASYLQGPTITVRIGAEHISKISASPNRKTRRARKAAPKTRPNPSR